jgi:hypothetical protein
VLAVSVTLVAAFLLPSTALGASDAASTEAYVRANYALTSAGHRFIHTGRARIAALRRRLRSECPAIVAGSPQNTQSEQLTWEVIGAMTIVGYQPGVGAATTYARAVSKLSWSSSSLTRAVRAYARQGLTEVHTPLPDVCGDLRAWKASGYTTLPASTVHFRKTFYENYVGVGFMPSALLRMVAPAQKALVQRSRRYEEGIAEVEALEVETFGEIIDSLGLNQ